MNSLEALDYALDIIRRGHLSAADLATGQTRSVLSSLCGSRSSIGTRPASCTHASSATTGTGRAITSSRARSTSAFATARIDLLAHPTARLLPPPAQ
jgi:hypothetical protein